MSNTDKAPPDESEDVITTGCAAINQPARTYQYKARRAQAPARDYQIELVDDLARALAMASAGTRIMTPLATGGGKTRVLNDCLWQHAVPIGANILWLAPC